MTHRRLSISPATGIALLALFFALGGSALAVGERVQSLAVAQQRCTQGAVRGIATVVGDPSKGLANMPDQFTSSGVLFSRRFNCTGKAVQARRVGTGIFEVRFVDNGAQSAVASGPGTALASVERIGGVFRVSMHSAGSYDFVDLSFTIVAV